MTLACLHEEELRFASQWWASLSTKGSSYVSDWNSYSICTIQGSLDTMGQNAADKAVIVFVVLRGHVLHDSDHVHVCTIVIAPHIKAQPSECCTQFFCNTKKDSNDIFLLWTANSCLPLYLISSRVHTYFEKTNKKQKPQTKHSCWCIAPSRTWLCVCSWFSTYSAPPPPQLFCYLRLRITA